MLCNVGRRGVDGTENPGLTANLQARHLAYSLQRQSCLRGPSLAEQ